MDDCMKEPPGFGRGTQYVAPTNFAGAKQDDEIGLFREMVSRYKTADNRKQKYRRIQRRKELRLGESLFVLDRNPMWMTLLFPRTRRKIRIHTDSEGTLGTIQFCSSLDDLFRRKR